MAFSGVVTGNLGRDPELRYTQSGKAVLELNIAATAQRKDRDTERWGDDGEPLWVRASLWGWQAEAAAEVFRKGDRVSVEGTLVLREYQRRDGGTGLSYELAGARLLGIIPKSSSGSSQAASYPRSQPNPHGTPQTSAYAGPRVDTGCQTEAPF